MQIALRTTRTHYWRESVLFIFSRWHSTEEAAPDYGLLKDFLHQLRRFLEQVEQLYLEFQEAMRTTEESSQRASLACKKKARAARTRRDSTITI